VANNRKKPIFVGVKPTKVEEGPAKFKPGHNLSSQNFEGFTLFSGQLP